jgi:hypothetical protein
MESAMGTNRRYKDSVFTLLFGEPDKMLGLYNALTGSNIPIGTHIENATLTDALFMDRINKESIAIS